MKVGIDGRYAQKNLVGIGKYVKNLAEGLSDKGFECVIFYSEKPDLRIEGANTVILKTSNRYYFEQILLPLALRKNKVDVYHATGNSGVPFFSSIPAVLTVHDIIPLEFKGYFKFSKIPFLSKNIFRLNLIISCYKARKMITVSKFVKQQMVDVFSISPEKIRVIYSGVRFGKLGILPDGLIKKKYILSHGGIDVRKNLEGTIKAFAIIKKVFSGYKLVITGENPELKVKLQNIVEELNLEGSVVFTGYVSDNILHSLIKNASCICYLSFMEGFGMPVLESFVAGVPVVCSNRTALPEIGDNAALLVNPNDCKQIALAVISVLKDERKSLKMIKAGKKISERYNWLSFVKQTIEVYGEALR